MTTHLGLLYYLQDNLPVLGRLRHNGVKAGTNQTYLWPGEAGMIPLAAGCMANLQNHCHSERQSTTDSK